MEKIFAPEESRALIRGWLFHARKEWKKHGAAARRLESQYRGVGISSVILSAIVGASLFGSLETAYAPWGRIVAGMLSILASVLASLLTFQKYEERTEKHLKASAEHKAALRTLERLHASLNSSTPDASTMGKLESQFLDLEKFAPVVPERINRAVEDRYEEFKFVPTVEELA